MIEKTEVQIVRIQIIAIIGSLLLILFIFNLIRKGKLKEKHALLWFGASLVTFFLSIFRGLLEKIAHFIGIDYPPAALFLAAMIFGFLLFLYYSIILSDLIDKNKKLAQEIGVLKREIEILQSKRKSKEARRK